MQITLTENEYNELKRRGDDAIVAANKAAEEKLVVVKLALAEEIFEWVKRECFGMPDYHKVQILNSFKAVCRKHHITEPKEDKCS